MTGGSASAFLHDTLLYGRDDFKVTDKDNVMVLYTFNRSLDLANGILLLPYFFFNDTATTEIYTLSLHDALPISTARRRSPSAMAPRGPGSTRRRRSEEHTSELQSPCNLVCRLLLEKKKKNITKFIYYNKKNKKLK